MSRFTLIAALLAAALPLTACATTDRSGPARDDPAGEARARPTAAYHEHHAEVRMHLDTADVMLAELRSVGPTTQREHMAGIVDHLEKNLRPHMQSEERSLYDFADEKANRGGERYTACLRYEHVIMNRWMDELRAEAASPERDIRDFARRGDRLVGLIRAHLETEEQVVLPMLDSKSTADEFKRRVL